MSGASLIRRTFGHDGGRQVTVFLPAAAPEGLVIAGDGELIASWGPRLEPAGAPPTAIVGVHRASDEDARLKEYSPGFDPEFFAAHERFVMDEVLGWVRSELGIDLPRERTAMAGVSVSGELALALALRQPEVFGAVLCASPGGGFQPCEPLPTPLPRAYFVAGALEPWFAENARRWADALGAAGGQVMITEREGDHGDPFWAEEFAPMVAWAFDR